MGRVRWWLVAALGIAVLPLGAAADRVEAVARKAMRVGQPATLEVRLVDTAGQPLAAPRDLRVELVGAERLTEHPTFRLPAGESGVAIDLVPSKAGAWAVEVVVEGFPSAWVPCTVFEPANAPRGMASIRALGVAAKVAPTLAATPGSRGADAESEPAPRTVQPLVMEVQRADRPQLHLPTARPTERPVARPVAGAAGRPGQTHPDLPHSGPGPAARPDEPAGGAPPPPAAAPAREVRLIPANAQVVPGPDGTFTLPINVYWYENGVPALRQQGLRVSLVADPATGDLRFDPERVEIPAEDFQAVALLTAAREGRIGVKALYPGGESSLAMVEMQPPRPAVLRFAGGDETERLRAVASADLPVLIQLQDRLGRPVPAPQQIAIDLVLRGGARPDTERLVLPAGAASLEHVFQVGRFDEYVLTASAGGLESAERQVEVRFDYALLLWALLGGLAGAALRLLWERRVRRGRTVARILVLGVAAAGIVLLLAGFGVLSGLEKLDPGGLWSLLETLPVSSQAAVFLLGLLTGFTADALFRLLTRLRRGAAPKPA